MKRIDIQRGKEVPLGVARYIGNPDQESAEFAVVVGDAALAQLAPPGAHVASLFCQHFSYRLPDGKNWDACRDEAADLVIDTVNRHAPNFKASILGGLCPRCGPGKSPADSAKGAGSKSGPQPPVSEMGRIRYFGDYELLEEIARIASITLSLNPQAQAIGCADRRMAPVMAGVLAGRGVRGPDPGSPRPVG